MSPPHDSSAPLDADKSLTACRYAAPPTLSIAWPVQMDNYICKDNTYLKTLAMCQEFLQIKFKQKLKWTNHGSIELSWSLNHIK